jgi:hypothetical protein
MRRLLVVSLVAVTLPAFAAPVVLEQVEALSGPTPGVRLTLSAPVTPVAHPLRAPERITLDLPGTVLGSKVRQPLVGTEPVARIRMGQLDGGVARVVLDLTAHARFTVETEGRVVTLVLTTAASTAPVAEPAPADVPAAAPPPAAAPAPSAPPATEPAPSAPAVEPTAAASTVSSTPAEGERASGTRGLFLDYTGLFTDPDAPVFPEPERQPHLHVGQQP